MLGYANYNFSLVTLSQLVGNAFTTCYYCELQLLFIANFNTCSYRSLILVNTASMCTVHYDPSPGYTLAMQVANVVFTVLFAAETSIRLIGLGRHQFFRFGMRSWNVFDLFLVLVSIADLLVQYLANSSSSGSSGSNSNSSGSGSNSGSNSGNSAGGLIFVTRILRLMRVTRLFRLIRHCRGLRLLLLTLVYSLPALTNIGSLLLLVFFVFAVLGVDTFGSVELGGGLTRHANFQNFPTAFATLVRVCTGEAFNEIM
jgi:hypothetical protein